MWAPLTCVPLSINPQADIPRDIFASTISVADSLLLHPGADNSLVVWNMENQKELGRLVGHDQRIRAVEVRGNLAVTAQDNGSARLWNLETMRCAATLPGLVAIAYACSLEGKILLGSVEGPIKLWDIAASTPVALPDLEGHTGIVYSIKASANTVLSGSEDKTVRLWDLRTGNCVRTMEGHTGIVRSVDMDGHCRIAVSGSEDKAIRLWDLGSGRCSATFEGHSSLIRDVVMHESGSSFLSSGWDDFIVNAWAVSCSKASTRADMRALCSSGIRANRLFASRDLSQVLYCGISAGTRKLEIRLWR